MSSIRLAVDAVVEHQGDVLLVKYEDARFGPHFGLPGGGVEPNETLHEAIRREVREETGADVAVGSLLLVNEYIPELYIKNMVDANPYDDQHHLRLVFHCHLRTGNQLDPPSQPDEDQVGVAWLPLEQLVTVRLLPGLGKRLVDILTTFPQPDIFDTSLSGRAEI